MEKISRSSTKNMHHYSTFFDKGKWLFSKWFAKIQHVNRRCQEQNG